MICNYCGKEFIPSKNDKRIIYCSEKCRLENRKVNNYMKKYYSENLDKWPNRQKQEQYKTDKNEARREKYKSDESYREKVKSRVKDFNKRNPHVKKNGHLSGDYGITLEKYNEIFEKQGGKCAICGSENSGSKTTKYFFVDHDHSTGKVRGLLCCKCNFGIGQFNDDIELLKNAIKYLKES